MQRSGWPRRLAVALALLVGLGLVVTLIARLVGSWRLERAKAEFEEAIGPLDLAGLMRPEIPRDRNAATWLLEGAALSTGLVPGQIAAAAVSRGGAVDLSKSLALEPIAAWDEAQLDRARQLARTNRPAYEAMARSLDCTAWSYEIDYLEGPGAEIPPLAELLRAARLVLVDAKLGLVDGDPTRFERDVAILDRLATSLTDEPTLITALVGIGVERYLLDAVWELAGRDLPDRALAERLAATLATKDPQSQLRRGLHGEAALISEGIAGIRRFDPSYATDLFDYPGQVWLALPFDQLLTAATLTDYVEISRSFGLPWPELSAIAAKLGPAEGSTNPIRSLAANLEVAVARLKEYESSLQLARLALDYRLGGTTGPLPVDPFSGQPVELGSRADGSVHFVAAGAEELWRNRFEEAGSRTMPRFAWTATPRRGA